MRNVEIQQLYVLAEESGATAEVGNLLTHIVFSSKASKDKKLGFYMKD